MKYPKTAAACAGAAVVASTMVYGQAEAVAIPGIGLEIPPEVMQMLIPLLAFFIPTILSSLFPQFPQLGEIVMKIIRLFVPELKPLEGAPPTSLIDQASNIATILAQRGDDAGVKCANHLHSHLLDQTTAATCKAKAVPDETPQD